MENKQPLVIKPQSPGKNPLSASLPSPAPATCNQLGQFDTVQDFWKYWNTINLPTLHSTQLKLLKANINPNPEDPSNSSGGKWVISCDKSQNIAQIWLYCLLALIGEQFRGDYIVGSVISLGVRNTISIWTSGHSKKCLEVTEKDIYTILNITKDKMRYQKHVKDSHSKPTKNLAIKVSKSVDLTHGTAVNLSPPSNSSSPRISPSTSSLNLDEDDRSAYIDLTGGSSKKVLNSNKGMIIITSPRSSNDQISLSTNLSASTANIRHRKSLSNQFSSSQEPTTSSRMAVSIDTSDFRKWRSTESISKTSVLPPLFRRKGRKLSTDKSPPPRTLSPHIPDTILEARKEHSSSEREIPVIVKPMNITTSAEKPQVISSPQGFLGLSYIAWLGVMGLLCVIILGTYISLFSPRMNVNTNY